MNATEKNDLNKELTLKLGLCWHEFHKSGGPYYICRLCKNKFGKHREFVESMAHNPDFTTTDGIHLLLKEMVKREIEAFVNSLTRRGILGFIEIYILDTTGKLAKAANDFLPPLKGKEEEP